jgi:AcrR family transcriptional regulator
MAVVHRCGYHASTVADIAAAAGVSRGQFYKEFACKADAFVAAYERGFELALARCGHAFFSAQEWPERVWASARALTEFLAGEPALCYLGFVECHAVGREFSRRVNDTQQAFTLFLEEGYRQTTAGTSLSRMCSTLTATAIAEAAFLAARAYPGWYIRRLQPLAVYLALTPFIGSREAGLFVSGKLGTTTRTT